VPSAFIARSRLALLAFALCCGLAAPARGDDDTSPPASTTLFDRGADLLAAGDVDGAARSFEEAATVEPSSPLAADALFSAAKLREERLAQPQRALELYRRIAKEYPSSRVALAATRRLRDLGPKLVGVDAAPALASWKALLHGYADRPRAESLAQARELLDRHPHWSGRAEVLLWLGDQERGDGNLDEASRLYGEARAQEPAPEPFELQRREVDLALSRGDLARAERLADALDAGGDPGRLRVKDHLRARVEVRKRRELAYRIAFVVLALCALGLGASVLSAAGSIQRALQELRRPPIEVWFAVPVFGILFLMSLSGYRDIGTAVAIVGAAGSVFIWLSGTASRLSPRPWWRALLHLAAVVLAVVASAYVALHRGGLLDQILETVRFGPDV